MRIDVKPYGHLFYIKTVCDNCGATVLGSTEDIMREQLRDYGFKHIDGKDYCRSCYTQDSYLISREHLEEWYDILLNTNSDKISLLASKQLVMSQIKDILIKASVGDINNITIDFSDELGFTLKESRAIINIMKRHKPDLATSDDYIKYWHEAWNRNYSFEDIVDYEYQYVGEYCDDGKERTKEDIAEYIRENYLECSDDLNLNGWVIYKIHDNLWIEKH